MNALDALEERFRIEIHIIYFYQSLCQQVMPKYLRLDFKE